VQLTITDFQLDEHRSGRSVVANDFDDAEADQIQERVAETARGILTPGSARDPERQRFLASLRIRRIHGLAYRRLSDYQAEERAAFIAIDWLLRSWLPKVADYLSPNDVPHSDIIGCVEALRQSAVIGDYDDLLRMLPEIVYLEKEIDGLPDYGNPDGDEAWTLVHRTGFAAVSAAIEDSLACPMLDSLLSIVCDLAEGLANRAISRGVNCDALLVDSKKSAVECLGRMKASVEAVVAEAAA
jgi:hypothetical protein